MKGLFYEKKTRLGSMPPGCHNRCGECKPCIAVKEPMVPAHGPDDPGYGNAVPVEVSSWSSIAKSYDYKPLGWKFIQENFHVHSIRNNIDELTAALYLQVSLVSQALIFVTRSRSWSFIERPGLMLLSAFLVAQLVATLIAVYANWEFARIQGIGWGWAGVIWLYSIVFYIPLDVLKFMIRYALSGKAWDHMLQNKYIHAKDGAIQRSYVLFPNLKQLYIVSTLMTRDNLPCLISFSQNCPLLEELYIDVAISLLRVLLFVARPRTCALGNIPDSMIYRSVDQYPATHHIPGILILQIEAPIYFANSSYLRERISRWINEEEDQLKSSGETSLQYLILDMSGKQH